MDTTYYTFQSRKIKASGGADLVTFVPAVQPGPKSQPTVTPGLAPAGEVLDFDLCRRRLETRAAWKDLAAVAQRVGEVQSAGENQDAGEAQATPHRPARRGKARTRAPWVDILASALALGLVCLVGAAALLSIV